MEEEHYDTPWEFKSTSIAAAICQKIENADFMRASTSSDKIILSEENNSYNLTKLKNQQKNMLNLRRFSVNSVDTKKVLTTKQFSPQLNDDKQKMKQALVPLHRNRLSFGVTQNNKLDSTDILSKNSSLFVNKSNLLTSNDTKKRNIHEKTNAQKSFLNTYPLVGHSKCICGVQPTVHKDINLSNKLKKNYINSTCLKNQQNFGNKNFLMNKKSFENLNIIHEEIERSEAETLLKSKEIGDFLLRSRKEGNLALSLKSTDNILHIKLEKRNDSWVLGEGPSFPTVNSMIRCYRKTELPVRGAEHVKLKNAITVNNFLQN